MSEIDTRAKRDAPPAELPAAPRTPPPAQPQPRPPVRILPFIITLIAVAAAIVLAGAMWRVYMLAPWTRDGTVRAYVVTMAPEVAGKIVELPVADNQYVHKGDLLMIIDPTDYEIALHQAQAAADQAKAVALNAQAEATRREKLTDLSISLEQRQIYESSALSATAAYQATLAGLDKAKVNLQRTRIVAPVNGYVTNLLVQLGDYVNVGQKSISVVNADSYWIDGYFEETSLDRIHVGDAAIVKLMSHRQVLHGHVDSVARGIDVANAQADASGLASVNPIFTWVRLAQRVPVRIHIDQVPAGVRLVAGMTATVEIESLPSEKLPPDR
jgi:multidrug resistance efflux pump